MNKITSFLSFSFVFFTTIVFSQNESFELKSRPSEFDFFEHRNDSVFLLKTPINTISSTQVFESKLPYPMVAVLIFV